MTVVMQRCRLENPGLTPIRNIFEWWYKVYPNKSMFTVACRNLHIDMQRLECYSFYLGNYILCANRYDIVTIISKIIFIYAESTLERHFRSGKRGLL